MIESGKTSTQARKEVQYVSRDSSGRIGRPVEVVGGTRERVIDRWVARKIVQAGKEDDPPQWRVPQQIVENVRRTADTMRRIGRYE
jgi:hypothetical protein